MGKVMRDELLRLLQQEIIGLPDEKPSSTQLFERSRAALRRGADKQLVKKVVEAHLIPNEWMPLEDYNKAKDLLSKIDAANEYCFCRFCESKMKIQNQVFINSYGGNLCRGCAKKIKTFRTNLKVVVPDARARNKVLRWAAKNEIKSYKELADTCVKLLANELR